MRFINLTLAIILSIVSIVIFDSGTLWQVDMAIYGFNGIVLGLEASALSSFLQY